MPRRRHGTASDALAMSCLRYCGLMRRCGFLKLTAASSKSLVIQLGEFHRISERAFQRGPQWKIHKPLKGRCKQQVYAVASRTSRDSEIRGSCCCAPHEMSCILHHISMSKVSQDARHPHAYNGSLALALAAATCVCSESDLTTVAGKGCFWSPFDAAASTWQA